MEMVERILLQPESEKIEEVPGALAISDIQSSHKDERLSVCQLCQK